MNDLLHAASPAVLTTSRKDGSALTTPVWFRFEDGAFEVVIAAEDVKTPGVLVRLRGDRREWDLSAILPG